MTWMTNRLSIGCHQSVSCRFLVTWVGQFRNCAAVQQSIEQSIDQLSVVSIYWPKSIEGYMVTRSFTWYHVCILLCALPADWLKSIEGYMLTHSSMCFHVGILLCTLPVVSKLATGDLTKSSVSWAGICCLLSVVSYIGWCSVDSESLHASLSH